eukprot:31376-Pelagococcus_subviridis.AAC.14
MVDATGATVDPGPNAKPRKSNGTESNAMGASIGASPALGDARRRRRGSSPTLHRARPSLATEA